MKQTFQQCILGCVVALSLCGNLLAQQQAPQPNGSADERARTQSAIDQAMAQAMVQAGNKAGINDKPGFSPSELKRNQNVDIGAVAEKYKDAGGNRPKLSQDLMVFVSTSLPPKALELLGTQAARAGAVLVLRGIRGKLGTKGAMNDTIALLEPAAKAGASIQINPEAFKRYDIKSVPTFVLAANEEGCGNDQCASQAYSLVGDVTLEYALETWSTQGGVPGKQADVFLRRLQPRDR